MHISTVSPTALQIAIYRTEIEKKIYNVVLAEADKLGYSVVNVEMVPQAGKNTLRIYLDLAPLTKQERQVINLLLDESSEEKSEKKLQPGITLEDCAVFSRQIDAILDNLEGLTGAFDLEVSSPGLERPLLTWSDFESRLGQLVALKIHPHSGVSRKNVKGKLLTIKKESAELEIEESVTVKTILPAGAVRKANLVIQF